MASKQSKKAPLEDRADSSMEDAVLRRMLSTPPAPHKAPAPPAKKKSKSQ